MYHFTYDHIGQQQTDKHIISKIVYGHLHYFMFINGSTYTAINVINLMHILASGPKRVTVIFCVFRWMLCTRMYVRVMVHYVTFMKININIWEWE